MRNSKSSVAVACFLPGRAKDLSAALYVSLIIQLSFQWRTLELVCLKTVWWDEYLT